MFGSLSPLSIYTEEHDYTMKLQEAVSSPPVKPLLDEPRPTVTINTGYLPLRCVSCLSEEEVWTCGNNEIMKLLNLQVKNKQIQTVITQQRWRPWNVCSTSSDDILVTMDREDKKQSKVVRYVCFIEKQTIQFDYQGRPLYSSGGIKYISENRNLDICVADRGAKAVVVVN
ncbi:uncharacterized protein LOC125656213 [Ostrea edulis]|uniref:uncharacterized protein LOC125656213 n=1 Tax=Ostrea edulis TaxID=37623 RepID=UPI0024AF2D98|nr:uncharacterized protein LOC125656213 [Ostrea edulis]